MSRVHLILFMLLAGIGVACAPGSVHAQAPVHVIRGGPTCDECRIQRYKAATISDGEYLDGALIGQARIYVLTDRSFLVSAGPEIRTELFRAHASGAIFTRVGATGDGPGEYRLPWHVAQGVDSYYIFDVMQRRTTRLSRDFEVLDVAPLPDQPYVQPLMFADGRYLLNSTLGRPGEDPPALHIVSPSGQVLRSFSPAGPKAERVVALSGDSLILVARTDRYRIEAWDTTGVLRSVYERQAGWFEPSEELHPNRRLSAMHESDGKLWVRISEARRLPHEVGVMTLFWDKSASTTILEVLDLARRRSVALGRVDGHWGSTVPGPGMFDSVLRQLDTGEVVVDVWAYQLGERQ